MELTQVKIKGFRNFKDATINFSERSLIIGANDIGKSNLIHALRILLDRSFSELAIEPKDSDFYAYEETNEFSILIKFTNIFEDIIKSRLREYISDNNETFLCFKAYKDENTNEKKFKYFAGNTEEALEEIDYRFYLKVLNLKYISSHRDLLTYIKKERKNLFLETKKRRDEVEINNDETKLSEIKTFLNNINTIIPDLSYVKNSTQLLNQELERLSFRHSNHKVLFDVGTSDPLKLIDNVKLISKYENKRIESGGDGKNNQIFFALWAAKNEIQEENLLEVTIYCIEEPEVHLHPHQQRKLAEYLSTILKSQVFITSHSPQIASEFSPNDIIRLLLEDNQTVAAKDGCSKIIEESFTMFGHRLSIIPAEAFFSNVVFLVEGTSELLFYKALSKEIGIDLDRLNISILTVEGVGFEVYIQILEALEIKWVLKTDNDVFKIPKSTKYRYAGIQRCLQIYKKFLNQHYPLEELIHNKESFLSDFEEIIPQDNIIVANEFINELEKYSIYISSKDLEHDILESEIKQDLIDFYETDDENTIISLMQKKKASSMYSFLAKKYDSLSKLSENKIVNPLKRCVRIAEEIEII